MATKVDYETYRAIAVLDPNGHNIPITMCWFQPNTGREGKESRWVIQHAHFIYPHYGDIINQLGHNEVIK